MIGRELLLSVGGGGEGYCFLDIPQDFENILLVYLPKMWAFPRNI